MAKKNQTILDDFIEIAAVFPWWLGASLALVSYFLLHSISALDVHGIAAAYGLDSVFLTTFFHVFFFLLQFMVPFIFLSCAVLSAFNQQSPRNSHDTIFEQLEKDGPVCPQCGSSMVKRVVKVGSNTGYEYWGCSRFPECHGSKNNYCV